MLTPKQSVKKQLPVQHLVFIDNLVLNYCRAGIGLQRSVILIGHQWLFHCCNTGNCLSHHTVGVLVTTVAAGYSEGYNAGYSASFFMCSSKDLFVFISWHFGCVNCIHFHPLCLYIYCTCIRTSTVPVLLAPGLRGFCCWDIHVYNIHIYTYIYIYIIHIKDGTCTVHAYIRQLVMACSSLLPLIVLFTQSLSYSTLSANCCMVLNSMHFAAFQAILGATIHVHVRAQWHHSIQYGYLNSQIIYPIKMDVHVVNASEMSN